MCCKKDKKIQDPMLRQTACVIKWLAVIVAAVFICDVFNLGDCLNIHLRFDWPSIICSFASAVATIALGVVALKQNKK